MTKTVQIVELRYKRCDLRFGVGTCTATGTPKCFQTYNTCLAKDVYNLDGEIRWYFHRHGDPVPTTAGLPTANEVRGPSIPILRTVRTEPTRINLGAVREGESPFGLRGTVSVTLDDFEFRNQFGDFYASERTVQGSIGRLLLAWLGEAVPQLEMYLYTGKEGDSLAAMTVRRYDVTNISPPSGGAWTVTGLDPLAKAERKKAQFPPATDLRLQSDIDTSTTTISVSGLEADVNKPMGNDGLFYGRLSGEIISYTGYTGSAGIWSLSGVVRGALGTTADEHSVDDGLQRVGHYSDILYWQMVYDQLSNHTTIPPNLIPVRENLIPYSSTFSEWFAFSNTSVFSDVFTAPDGTGTADRIAKTGAATFQYLWQSATSSPGKTYTASVYLRSGTASFSRIRLFGSPIAGSSLADLTVDWSNPAATGESVGAGWYRFSITGEAINQGLNFLIYPSGSSSNTGDVFAWGAQVELGSVATDQITTLQNPAYAGDWADEGQSWLSTLAGTGTFTEPRAVSEVCAEAMRDGMFSIWWDEREQEIKMLANRQPDGVVATLTERNALVTTALKRTPDDRRTRVTIYYDRRDPTESLTETRNYRQQRIRIDAEAEGANFADGTVRNLIWYSPLLRTDLNAILVQASFLQRYRTTPRYLDLQLAYKDADLAVGDVIYVESHDILDILGNPTTEPWQVIEWEETEPGFAYRVLAQSFILFERPSFIMENTAPDFASATDAQKENACYITENTGLMPDGTTGYVIQ